MSPLLKDCILALGAGIFAATAPMITLHYLGLA